MTEILITFGPPILIFVVFCYLCSAWEKRRWNSGKCRKHSRTWKYFDTDSQGGRGYKCEEEWKFEEDAHGRRISLTCVEWISWPVDR